MSQIRLRLTVSEQQAETLLELLGIEFEEEGYAISTMEMEEGSDIWDISIYADEDAEADIMARSSKHIADAGITGTFQTEILPDIDWVSLSLEGLKPVRAGRFVVYGSHDKQNIASNELSIEVNAGQAFGSGHHGTTAGCLEMIEMVHKAHRGGLRALGPILDVGTGSGVLAIGAAKLSNVKIIGTDIDPIATKTARENAKLNGVSKNITFETANGFAARIFKDNGPFGLIIANILPWPLMKMAPDIHNHLAPDGSIILSGILAHQRLKVISAFNIHGRKHVKTLWRDGWVTILMK